MAGAAVSPWLLVSDTYRSTTYEWAFVTLAADWNAIISMPALRQRTVFRQHSPHFKFHFRLGIRRRKRNSLTLRHNFFCGRKGWSECWIMMTLKCVAVGRVASPVIYRCQWTSIIFLDWFNPCENPVVTKDVRYHTDIKVNSITRSHPGLPQTSNLFLDKLHDFRQNAIHLQLSTVNSATVKIATKPSIECCVH